ncbi:MAG TPA: hypothetical protein VMV92_34120 [Streptosporangiaceae bacterium]|nr:hypothetical protein [Streptosporangiaceae bacterium]
MPEFYTLVEMESYQQQTMPPMTSKRPLRLHAAVDGEDGEITAACSYPVVSERDVPKRDLPFSAGWKTVVQRAPECPECAAAIEAAA